MPHVDEGTLHAYLDGELALVERGELEAHLAQCSTCRMQLTEARALSDRASHLLGLATPRNSVAPPLEQLRRPKRRFWEVRTTLAWAATIVLALSIGYYARDLWAPMRESEPQSGIAAIMNRTAPAHPASQATDSVSHSYQDRTRQIARARPPAAVPRPQVSEQKQQPAPVVDEPRVAARAERIDSMAVSRQFVRRSDGITAPAAVAPSIEGPFVTRAQARSLLGSDPVGVPGLPVRRIRPNPGVDSSVIVEQQLDSGVVILVFQGRGVDELDRERAGARASEYAGRYGAGRLAKYVGPLRVEIAAPLSADSLNRLLEQLKPLP